MITPERWQQIKVVLGRALELEPSRRSAYLDEASASDPSLRVEVERLLAAEQRAGKDFLGDTATHPASQAVSSAVSESRVGLRLGPYKIVEPVGEGGMGTVYRAIRADDQYQKQVAIKLIQAGQASAFIVSRFKNERQILASLDHPNIARLLDGGTSDDGAPYFVMEMIEGRPIDEYCDHHRLPTNERLGIFLQVCAAVQFAHQRLIIHRDIKPGNILVGADGIPKLLDFGIAKLFDPASGGEDATMTVFRALTPGYASPEQIKGAPITTASDVYSLGVVLYELLTGHSPYRVASRAPHELARAVCETDPERPSTAVTRTVTLGSGGSQTQITPASTSAVRDGSPEKLRRGLRGDLDNIVLMALRKEPERRYASVEQFAEDIRRHLSHLPVSASKGTVSYRAGKFVARHKAGVLATAVVALTLIAGLVATLREAHIARQQAAIAQAERARAQRRFDDVRKLANSLIFEVHDSIRDLPGSTPARKLIMDRAVQYLDSLAKDAGGDSSLQRDLAWAYHRVGQVQGDANQGNVGQTDAMLASINKAAALFEDVAKANPTSSLDQLNAAFANRMLGTISSHAEERRRHIDQALAITEGLLKTDPKNPKVKNERSIELAVLAALQDQEGDASGAVQSYRQSVAVKEDLLASNPDYPHVKQGLGMAKVQTAIELAEIGSRKEALRLNAAGIDLYQSVVAQEKNNARAARELGWSMGSRGDIQMMDGDFAEALADYRRMLANVEPMAKQDPQNVMLQVDVGGATASIGKALVSAGKVSQGLPVLDRGIAILESQISTDPYNAPAGAAASYVWKGDALLKTGKVADAVASDRKAISILEAAAQGGPPDQPHPPQLAATYLKLGAALASAGRAQEAGAAYRKCLELVESSKASDAPSPRDSYILADAYFGLGELSTRAAERSQSNSAEQLRQRSQARDWYRKSEDAWRHILNPAFVNPEGFQCGSPSRATAAREAAEKALQAGK